MYVVKMYSLLILLFMLEVSLVSSTSDFDCIVLILG